MATWEEALEIAQSTPPAGEWDDALKAIEDEGPKDDPTPAIMAEGRRRALQPVMSGTKVDPYADYLEIASQYGLKHGDNPKLQESFVAEYENNAKRKDVYALGQIAANNFSVAGRHLAAMDDAKDQGVFMEALRDTWESNKGKAGVLSEYSPRGLMAQVIPAPGVGAEAKGVEAYDLFTAVSRLEGDQKGEKIDAKQREKDLGLVYGYILHQEALATQGEATGAGFVVDVMKMPGFMMEFIMSGGLATVARKGAQKGIAKMLGDRLVSRLAQQLVGWTAAGAARAATVLQPRVIAGTIEGMTPQTGINISDDPSARVAIGGEEKSVLSEYAKSFADQTIEAMSEESGEAIGKFIQRVPGVKKLGEAWVKATGKGWSDFTASLVKKMGYHGTLEEMGEERVGAVMRTAIGIDPHEDKDTFTDRLTKAVYPGLEQLAREAALFSVPGVAQRAVGGLGNRFQTKSDIKQAEKGGLGGERLADWISKADPDGVAAAIEFAKIEQPSRKDAVKAGIKTHQSAEERKETAATVREVLATVPPEVVQAAKEGEPAAVEQVKAAIVEQAKAETTPAEVREVIGIDKPPAEVPAEAQVEAQTEAPAEAPAVEKPKIGAQYVKKEAEAKVEVQPLESQAGGRKVSDTTPRRWQSEAMEAVDVATGFDLIKSGKFPKSYFAKTEPNLVKAYKEGLIKTADDVRDAMTGNLDDLRKKHRGGSLGPSGILQAQAETPAEAKAEATPEQKPKLTYDEFAKKYRAAFKKLNEYTPDQVGSKVFSDEMAKLADEYPEWVEKVEDESRGVQDADSGKRELGDARSPGLATVAAPGTTGAASDEAPGTGEASPVPGAQRPTGTGRIGRSKRDNVDDAAESGVGERGGRAAAVEPVGGAEVPGVEASTEKHEDVDLTVKQMESEIARVDKKNAEREAAHKEELAAFEAANKPATEAEAAQKEQDHRIAAEDVIAPRGDVTRLKSNISAIKLLRALETENRPATAAEKKTLAQYVGWGGMSQSLDEVRGERMVRNDSWGRDDNWEKKWGKYYSELKDLLTPEEFESARASTPNAHYTDRKVIEAMWKMAQRMGFTKGTVLEPAAGIGSVLGLMPEGIKAKRVAVELDSLSGRMIQKLYPNTTVFNKGLENTPIPANSVDLSITNVPFGKDGPKVDSMGRYGTELNLHNYFIARILDALRPGGIGIVITTHHTADSWKTQRDILAARGELLMGIRLPNTAQAESANTEVTTDILILRKADGRNVGAETWTEVTAIPTIDDVPAYVNEYFARHPEQMLGKPSMAGKMYQHNKAGVEPLKREFTLVPDPDRPMEQGIQEATERLPEGIFTVKTRAEDFDFKAADEVSSMKERSLVERPDGTLAVVEDGKLVDAEKFGLNKSKTEMGKGFVRLRDAYLKHLDLMRSDATDEEVQASAAELETIYKDFRSRHATEEKGLAGDKMKVFEFDTSGLPLVQSLESVKSTVVNGKTETVTVPADVFKIRTQRPVVAPTSVESVTDGVRVSLAFRGKLDLDYVAELSKKPRAEVEKELTESGTAFENPESGLWETKEQYLSGFVREKLRRAIVAAKDKDQYQVNVDALTAVQPAPKSYSKIGARIGSAWIPADIMQEFLREMLGDRGAAVHYNKKLDQWKAKASNGDGVRNTTTFGAIGSKKGDSIFEALLNNKVIEVYKEVEYTDEMGETKTRRVLDQIETTKSEMAADKQHAEFAKWVKGREDIQVRLQDEFNELFNGYATEKWDGSHLVLPGANPEIKFRDYQKNTVWRMIQQGYGLIAHAVGGGKTYTAIALAMELRRLGLASKPMIVVQNATLGQFAASFRKLYPSAKVLVATPDDLKESRRNLFMARIASGDYDSVIVAQSSFDKLPNDPKREEEFLRAQLKELQEAIIEASAANRSGEGRGRQKDPTVKELEKAKKALQEKIDKLQDKVKGRSDQTVYFEQMGVDTIIVDEAHAYKKPFFVTKMNKIGGINRQNSGKAYNLQMKTLHIQEKNKGRGVYFMTGTPITNTLGESWLLTKLISPQILKKFNVDTFDRFASTFAKIHPETTMNAGGGWVRKNMLSKFTNGSELLNMIQSVWDVVTTEQLHQKLLDAGVGMPTIATGKMQPVIIQKTPAVASFNRFLVQVYQKYMALTGKAKHELSYIPVLTYLAARSAALDIRLVYPNAKEDPGSKVNSVAELALKIYKDSTETKGTQLIFSDIMNPMKMSSIQSFMAGEQVNLDIEEKDEDDDDEGGAKPRFIYDEIRKKLIAGGIPAAEIAVIHEYKGDEKRTALFTRMNAGEVRILIGSTSKMGVGVNVQTKAIAAHQLDTPWLPADIEQRIGRIMRQGNENKEIQLYTYGMKDTLDQALWAMMIRKSKFIRQAISGQIKEEEFDDPAGAIVLSAEQQLALLTGDTRVMQKVELEQSIRQLRWEAEAHSDAKAGQVHQRKKNNEDIAYYDRVAKDFTADLAAFKLDDKEKVVFTFGDKKVVGVKDARDHLAALIEKKVPEALKSGKRIELIRAHAMGMDIYMEMSAGNYFSEEKDDKGKLKTKVMTRLHTEIKGPSKRNNYDGSADSPQGVIESVWNTGKRLEQNISGREADIAQKRKDNEEIGVLLDQKWENADSLAEKETQLREIDASLLAAEHAPTPKKEVVEGEEVAEAEQVGFQVRNRENDGWVPAEDAKPIDIEGYPGLYVHKGVKGRKGWTVSEVSTGLRVGDEMTRAGVIESVKSNLEARGITPEKFKGLVEKEREKGVSPYYEQEKKSGNISYSLKPAAAGKITEADVRRTFPGATVTSLPEWSGWRVTFKSGYYVDIRWVDQVAIDWDAAEKAYGRTFTAAQRKSIAAAGSFELKTKDGREISGIGLMQLHNGLADDATLRHESIHLADRLGFFKPAEWTALVKKHSSEGKDRDSQAEDIARAREAWKGPQGLAVKVGGWFRGIMEDFGLVEKGVTAEEVHKAMDTAEFWARGVVKTDTQGRKTVDLYFGNPDLANPARNEGVRRQIDRRDEMRKQEGRPGVRHMAEVQAEAKEMLKRPSQIRARILSRAKSGIPLTDAETVAAKELLNTEGMKALKSGDLEALAEFGLFVEAYRDTGTAEARSFRMRVDPVETPAQRRQRALMEALMTPPKAQYELIQAARSRGDKATAEREHADWAKKAHSLANHLKVIGHDITDPGMFEDASKAANVLGTVEAAKAEWGDKVYEFWRNAILSHPATQAANITGNLGFGVYKNIAERLVEASVNVVMNQDDAAQFGEFRYLLRGLLPTIGRGFYNAVRAYKSETPYFESEVMQALHPTTQIDTPTVAIGGVGGRIVRAGFLGLGGYRMLTAADEFFKTIYTTADAGAQAYRIAKSEGLEGPAMEERINALLEDKASLAWMIGLRTAKTSLFQEEPGKFTRGILSIRNSELFGLKPLRWVLPFVVTPANIVRHGIRRTPLGSIALAKETYDSIRSGDYSKLPPRVAEQVIAWGVFMAFVHAITTGGDDDEPIITGAASSGTADTQLQYRTLPPLSIRLWGKWYSYSRIEPHATTIALIVDAINAGTRPGDWSQKFQQMFKSLTEQVKSKTFLSGISDIFEAFEGEKKDVIPKWISNFASSWVPNVFKGFGRASDELLRERGVWGEGDEWTTRMIQRTLAKTELGLSETDFPQHDLWGNEIKRHGARTNWLARMVLPWQVRETDPKRADLMLVNWNLNNPDNTYYPVAPSHGWTKKGEKVTLNDVEYMEYTKTAGQLTEKVATLFRWAPNAPTKSQVDRLKDILTESRQYTRDHFRGKVDVEAAAGEIKSDLISRWAEKLSKVRPVKRADLPAWESDIQEAKDWMKEVDRGEALKAYRRYLVREVKTPEIRQRKLSAFLNRLPREEVK